MTAVRFPIRKPRARSAKALAAFARRQIGRARHELIQIGGAYGDVDQYVVDRVDEIAGFAELIDAIQDAENSGRNAL